MTYEDIQCISELKSSASSLLSWAPQFCQCLPWFGSPRWRRKEKKQKQGGGLEGWHPGLEDGGPPFLIPDVGERESSAFLQHPPAEPHWEGERTLTRLWG